MHSTKYGGLEKFNVELVQQGVELSLVYNSPLKSKEYLKNIERYKIPVYIVEGGFLNRVIQIFRIISRERPNIIHYHFGKLMYFLAPLSRVFFPKLFQVYTIHCEFPQINRFEHFIMSICVRCLNLIICVSEGVKAGFAKEFGNDDKVIVSYLGVRKYGVLDTELKKKLNIEKNAMVLTSVGFDIEVKGYDILAEAVSELNKIGCLPHYKILLIGLSNTEEERLYKILDNLKIGQYFISVGIVDNIDDFLNISDIYLQPSRSEAISLSIMEAMQYGLPIVGTNTGGIPEVCINNRNGFLFDKGDHIALANIIYNLISNPILRENLGKESLALSSNFSLENSVRRLVNTYYNIYKELQ